MKIRLYMCSQYEDLISLARCKILPVIDDIGVFIGIVRRSDIIDYCYKIIVDCDKED